MKIWHKIVLILVVLMSLIVIPVIAGASNGTEVWKVPYNFALIIPCADDGRGEWVDFSGSQILAIHEFWDSSGGQHIKTHQNPQRLTGVGRTTGDIYVGTGAANSHDFYFPPDEEGNAQFRILALVQTFPVIGKGQAVNGNLHKSETIIWNANGELIVESFKHRFTCK